MKKTEPMSPLGFEMFQPHGELFGDPHQRVFRSYVDAKPLSCEGVVFTNPYSVIKLFPAVWYLSSGMLPKIFLFGLMRDGSGKVNWLQQFDISMTGSLLSDGEREEVLF